MMAGPPSSMRVLFAIVLLLISTIASLAAPNIVVIMTDDQDDTGSMAYMPKTLSLHRRARHHLQEQLRERSAVRAEPRLVPHRTGSA
jgi:hypothetical protein